MLNILICSLESRKRQLGQLLSILNQQIAAHRDRVSVIIESDNGEMSIGAKRNLLMSKATRRFVAYVDDDDTVSLDYVERILNAITRGENQYGQLHCVGMCGYIVENGERTWQFRHSITVANWCRDRRRKIYFRTPNHLNPIRRLFAQQCAFPEIQFGEDKAYSDKVKMFLTNEIFIEEPIYFYLQNNKG